MVGKCLARRHPEDAKGILNYRLLDNLTLDAGLAL